MASRLLMGWAGPAQAAHNINPYSEATRALQGDSRSRRVGLDRLG